MAIESKTCSVGESVHKQCDCALKYVSSIRCICLQYFTSSAVFLHPSLMSSTILVSSSIAFTHLERISCVSTERSLTLDFFSL
jgi:hypothetical protein